ncbi:hypothetical protein APSETT445_003898 [Aspergillus pseudonomiae]
MASASASDALRGHLAYEPVPLKFGTSGRRGKVVDLTQLEIYTNVLAEIRYLKSLDQQDGGIKPGDDFYFAYDLRPSSTSYVEESRGGLSQAVEQALKDEGMHPINLGAIPTPALTYYALKHGKGSIMHSAVGRDVLVEILEKLGAEVVTAGRSDTFVPIDTEAIDQVQLDTVQNLYDSTGQQFDAVVSTDGDSDRPLILAPEGGKLRFFGGDLLGMVVAEFLGADSVVVPISTNDAMDRGSLASVTEPKTKIGSPYVIAGMQHSLSKGRRRVCGWEANGGFLTGSDIERNSNVLTALPTRDAVLPLLCALFAAGNRGITLPELFATLPKRSSRAALIRNFPRATSLKIIDRFSPPESTMQEVSYQPDHVVAVDGSRAQLQVTESHAKKLEQIRQELETVFSPEYGFSSIARLNYTDGVRIIFANGDVAHFRPSGNADELRIYAVADTQERADAIASQGVAEPNGLLRSLERTV